jgi:hypothetical protein
MARIKTYPLDTLVTDKDIIIGTDADNFNETKNFKVETLRDYMLSGLEPEVGGNLKITTITATDEINLTPEDYFNNQDPAIEVLNYEIIFLILNGRTYIFRINGNTFGIGETQTSSSDFTEIDITSIINANLQDLQSVLTTGNDSDLDAIIMSLFLKNTEVFNHVFESLAYVFNVWGIPVNIEPPTYRSESFALSQEAIKAEIEYKKAASGRLNKMTELLGKGNTTTGGGSVGGRML